MKITKKETPQKIGPTKEELEEIQRQKREQAARDKIKQQMQFGGNGKGDGVSGTADGTAVNGTRDGNPGHNLAGRTVLTWGKNASTKSGTIRIAVIVEPDGRVSSARYAGGDGAAAADATLRSRTVDATRATRFSKSTADNPQPQRGTITWHFK